MLRPLRSALPRASSLSAPPTSLIHHCRLRRYNHTNSQPPSPTAAFYRTFTRPVAKCALIAVLVYQVVYFGWTKLEHEEIKAERQAEIAGLEAQVRGLQAAAAAAAAAARSGDGEGGDGKEAGKSGGSWWPWK